MNPKTNNIPSVHNYCDRWCERCRFIDRCAVGSSGKLLATKLKMDLAMTEEKRQEIMWQHVADSFVEAGRLLDKMIANAGLDIEAIRKEATGNLVQSPALTERQEVLKELTMEYGKDAHGWMNNNRDLFEPKILTSRALVQRDNREQLIRNIKDAIETVN